MKKTRNMKRNFFLVSGAVLLLAACVKNEVVVQQAELETLEEITISAYSGRQVTKAPEPVNIEEFKVSAFFTSDQDDYFLNASFEQDPSSGKYFSNPTKHWPLSGTGSNDPLELDFYAAYSNSGSYSVSVSTVSATNDTKTIVTDTPISGSDDLMVASVMQKKRGDDVSLVFGHKLTKINFTAVGEDTRLKYVVTGIRVKAMSKGKYVFGSSSWTDVSTVKSDYEYVLDRDTLNPGTATRQWLGISGSGLMLIPNQSSSDSSVIASISYAVYDVTAEGTDLQLYHGTRTIDLTQSAQDDWGINKSVVYNLTLPTGRTGSEISFSGDVSEWGPETVIEYIVMDWTEPASENFYVTGYSEYLMNLQGIFRAMSSSGEFQVCTRDDYHIETQNAGPIHGIFYYVKNRKFTLGEDPFSQRKVVLTASNASSMNDYFMLLDSCRCEIESNYISEHREHGLDILTSGYKYVFALQNSAQFILTYGTIEGNIGQLDSSSSISITGGTLIGNIDVVNAANVSITGGTFSFNPSAYVPSGYTVSQISTSPERWTVTTDE